MIDEAVSDPGDETPKTSGLPLFREQALERFHGSTWQPALLSKPVSGYLLVASAVLIGAGFLGFANSFEFARKEQVHGYLAPPTGWSRVKARDRDQLAHLQQEIRLSETRLGIAEQRYRDGQQLVSSGAISRADLVQLQDEVQTRRLSLSERRREAELLQMSLLANETRLAQLAVKRDLQLSGIKEQQHAQAIEEARVRVEGKTRVLAPRSGAVASIQVDAGDGVQPGQVLLDIVPRDIVLQARLFAPSAALGFIEPGQPVRVYLDAFPYERHGAQVGRIMSISDTAIITTEAGAIPSQVGPVYRLDVEFPSGFDLLPEQAKALRSGMTVTADLVHDYGTLVDWALAPLRGTARRL